jgi:translation initiation factor 5B
MAGGGIASGADPYKLPGMMKKLSDKQLGGKLDQKDTDPETMGIAQAEKQRRDQVRAGVTKMAGGGAVAFKEGGIKDITKNPFADPEEKPKDKEEKKEEKPVANKEVRAAKAPVSATPYQDMARADRAALDKPVPEIEKARTAVTDLEKRTAGGVEGEMDRRQAVYQKFGVDPVKMIAEERARHQEELKLSEEDYRKSQHLRYAQMFARFGSTPGPVLKAALVSINEVVPDLLDDKAKSSAVRREIKKAMFELDKSEYLEKKGNVDAAFKSHEEAVGRITALNMEIGKMVTETELKKTQATTELAGREIAAISGEKQTAMSSSATRYAADKREAGENKRAEIREAAEQRKAKEYENKVTAMTRAELREYDKANKEALDRANEMLSLPDNADSKLAKDQARITKARIEQERREKIMVLQQQYPESRIGQELERGGSGGDVDRSNPLLAK